MRRNLAKIHHVTIWRPYGVLRRLTGMNQGTESGALSSNTADNTHSSGRHSHPKLCLDCQIFPHSPFEQTNVETPNRTSLTRDSLQSTPSTEDVNDSEWAS